MNTIKVEKVVNRIFIYGLLLAFLDQFSKVFVQNYTEIPVSFNKGIAFSIPVPGGIQIFFTSLVLLLIIVYASRIVAAELTPRNKYIATLSLSCIFGGGLGNLMDRINLGHVVDFIDVGFWPIFNLADSFITVGAILLGVLWLRK